MDCEKILELKEILLRTQSPDGSVRKAGEAYLLGLENQGGGGPYAEMLASLIEMHCGADGALPNDVAFRTLAAILFKNLVRRRWQPDSDADSEKILPLPDVSKDNIKKHVVHMMCITPPEVQRQLSEALSIMSKYDFPAKWPALMPELVLKMGSKEQGTVLGALLTANSILKRYRYVFKSDKLFMELKYILEQMQEPLLQIFKQIGEALRAHGSMDTLMLSLLEMLRLCCRIFFSLNWQDLPEFFEDHMSEWMDEFNRYLSFGSDLDTVKNETFSGAIEKLQAAVVENLNLYADKYEEEFQPHLGPFSQAVWILLTKKPVGDVLATTCIRFLTSVVSKKIHEHLFKDFNTLKQIVENIVVPNLMLTTEEEELFEDNPMDYISRDMEGGDSDTRQRAASDLIKGMCKHHLEATTDICKQCIEVQLHQYESNVKEYWKAKDAAIKLLLAIGARSQTANGVSEVNPCINVMEIGATKLIPEIKDTNVNSRPIIRAGCIKFITTLRNQFTKEQWLHMLPFLVMNFTSSHIVVATYAGISIERALTVRQPSESVALGSSQSRSKPAPLIEPSDLQPFLQGMFSGLFGVLDNPELPENAYIMKTIMRCLAASGKSVILPVASDVLSKQCVYLAQVSRNPSNPLFNHYLFESIAVLVRSVCSSGNLATIDMFEAGLFPPFQNVLAQDVVEFTPYVFQILAQLLELRPAEQSFTAAYTALFPPLLSPPLWERKGNIPALTRLIRAYFARDAAALAQANHLDATFGVFQKLLSSRTTENQAYQLLESICMAFNPPAAPLGPYLQEVFRLLLMQLVERADNVRINRLFLHFVCVFVLKQGAAALESLLERCQSGLTVILLDQVVVKFFGRENKPVLTVQDRSLFTCGFVVLMGLSPAESDISRWKRLLITIMTIVMPEDDEAIENDVFEADEDVPEAIAYDATYSKLHFATNQTTTRDFLSSLSVNSDPKAFLVQKLSQYQQALGRGKILLALQEALAPKQLSMLQLLFHECGASLQ